MGINKKWQVAAVCFYPLLSTQENLCRKTKEKEKSVNIRKKSLSLVHWFASLWTHSCYCCCCWSSWGVGRVGVCVCLCSGQWLCFSLARADAIQRTSHILHDIFTVSSVFSDNQPDQKLTYLALCLQRGVVSLLFVMSQRRILRRTIWKTKARKKSLEFSHVTLRSVKWILHNGTFNFQ